jgi:hypothetical protein
MSVDVIRGLSAAVGIGMPAGFATLQDMVTHCFEIFREPLSVFRRVPVLAALRQHPVLVHPPQSSMKRRMLSIPREDTGHTTAHVAAIDASRRERRSLLGKRCCAEGAD